MCKSMDPPVRVMLLLTQDLRQFHHGLQANFPNGDVRDDMNGDFNSLIV